MAKTEKTWEERVIALETDLTAAKEALAGRDNDLAAMAAERDGLHERVQALEAALQAQKEAEQARKAAEFSAYCDGIKAEAAKAGAPITEDELTKVRQAFERGDEDTAKTLGDAFLTRSQALGGGAVRGDGPQKVTLGPNVEAAQSESMDRFYARFPHLKKGA